MIKRVVEFIFFGSIFIAFCVVAMCIETNLLLHIPLNNPGFYFFVFGASLVQYNLHYLVKKTALPNSARFNWSQKNAGIHLIIICCGLILIISGLFTFQLRHFIFLLFLGIVTLLYSLPVLPFTGKKRIKDFGVLKIITLSLLWTVVTVWFPVNLAYSINGTFLLIFVRRFIFIFVLCLVFDIRDVDIDRKENIRTIPVITGVKGAYITSYVLLLIIILISFIQYLEVPDAVQFTAMTISSFVTFFMIGYTKRSKSDINYLACIDGMMLLQSILVMIGSI